MNGCCCRLWSTTLLSPTVVVEVSFNCPKSLEKKPLSRKASSNMSASWQGVASVAESHPDETTTVDETGELLGAALWTC